MKSRITKFIITAVAATALAVPAVASAEYHQPAPAEQSCDSGHGSFGYFGEHGNVGPDGTVLRHDLGRGDTLGDGKLGASPLTGPLQKAAAEACNA